LPRFRTSSIGLFSPPAGGQLNECGILAARALIAPRRHSRALLHCLETVDYPCCRNDLSDQSKACRPRPYCIPVPVKRFSRNDRGGGVRRAASRTRCGGIRIASRKKEAMPGGASAPNRLKIAIGAEHRPRARSSKTFGSKLASNRRTCVRENRGSSDNVRFSVSDDTIAEGRTRSINVYSACEIW
jgi:hypothetical protein